LIPYSPAGTVSISRAKPFSLAQRVRPIYVQPKTLGETFDQMLGFSPMLGDLLRLGGHGLATWVGLYAAFYAQSKWVKAAGWIIGIGQGLAGVCDVISVGQRLVRAATTQTTTEAAVQGRTARPIG